MVIQQNFRIFKFFFKQVKYVSREKPFIHIPNALWCMPIWISYQQEFLFVKIVAGGDPLTSDNLLYSGHSFKLRALFLVFLNTKYEYSQVQ
jgi:hypothetical protein